jgi:hypothetical protein
MFLGRRNREGLTERQIEQCVLAWAVICGSKAIPLIADEAMVYGSRTRFVEGRSVVHLGADVYPGEGSLANSRLSVLACLVHEFSHVERYERGYKGRFMQKIEPTGVVFTGVCDIQTAQCIARTNAPITAVWSYPGRNQVNVCRECLEEMVRKGEWRIEGARIRQRADVIVYDNEGKITLVVEAKLTTSRRSSERQAIQIRRNLLVHAGLPHTPYFMVAFLDRFYLWQKAATESLDRPADAKIEAKGIVTHYAKVLGVTLEELTPIDFERLLSLWLKDISSSHDSTAMPSTLSLSGLPLAILNGSVAVEVAV